jgi:hypothetical protein
MGGRSLLRVPGIADLRDNRPLWAELWCRNRGALLARWLSESPGSRPPAWWEFDALGLGVEIGDDETEADALRRHDMLV